MGGQQILFETIDRNTELFVGRHNLDGAERSGADPRRHRPRERPRRAALDWLAKGNAIHQPRKRPRLLGRRGGCGVTGSSMEAEICPAAPATPPVLVSDSSKAREPLGWTPSYPELDPQIAHDWTWLRDEMPNM
jgi:hypothetical protein